MKIDAKMILKQAAAGLPKKGEEITAKILAKYAGRHWVTIYDHLEDRPCSLWMLQALTTWYQECGPLKPAPVDAAFQWYMGKAFKQSLPRNPFQIKSGRPSKVQIDDEDDDGPGGGGLPAPDVSPSGFSPTVGENPQSEIKPRPALGEAKPAASIVAPAPLPVCDFSVLASAAKCWRSAQSSRRERDAFIDACFDQPWALKWSALPPREGVPSPRRRNIIARLNELSGIQLRVRAKDPDAQAKREAIFSIIGPPYQDHRKRNQHSKGAYDEHAFGSAKNCLKGVLETDAIKNALKAAAGQVPSFDYCYQLLLEKLPSDARGEVADYLQRTQGTRAAYDGQVLVADATGIPVRVAGAWAEKRVGEKGNRNGFQKHWMHVAVDISVSAGVKMR